MLNKILAATLQKHLGNIEKLPVAWEDFISSVNESFNEYDDKIKTLEAAVENSTQQLEAVKEQLEKETTGLKNAHNELSRIFNQVNEGFFSRDIVADKYIQMSVGCEKIYGYSIADFFSNSQLWFQVIHPGDRHLVEKESGLLQKGIQTNSAYRIIHKDQSTRWIEVKAVPEIVNNILTRVEGVVNDITERKNAEAALLINEQRLNQIYNTVSDIIFMVAIEADGRFRFVSVNLSFLKSTGLQKEQVNGKYLNEVIPPASFNFVNEKYQRCVAEKNTLTWEETSEYPSGTKTGIVNINPVLDESGTCIMIIGSVHDITERKKAELQIAESEQRYRQIVETAQEGIWMLDKEFRTVFANKKLCDIFEYSPDEILGKQYLDFMDEERKELAKKIIRGIESGITENFDFYFLTKTGKSIWANLSVSPIWDNTGKFDGVLAMVTDITRRKRNEELLKKSEADLDLKNKELERKNKELEQFAYVASHDLQEPLRTISSFVKLLKQQYEGKLDEKADKYLSFIVDSSDRMKVLIKDLLDYSRIGIKNQLERVDCNSIIHDVMADIELVIRDFNAEIVYGDLPVINGYPTELKQLFQNLLINAIKFSKKDISPKINISVNKADGYWKFAFADNGIGIEKIHQERIFVIFQRLHTRSEYKGSGIGLSHCKKIVELHHGKIWVESEPGNGSIFYFTIPCAEGEYIFG